MAMGPGKYDGAATAARELTQAQGVVLIVFEGLAGSGFSVQAPAEVIAFLPEALRVVADAIERDARTA